MPRLFDRASSLQGLDVHGGAACGLTAEKKIGKTLNARFGFDSVDKDNACYDNSRFSHAAGFGRNGDSYGLGTRFFVGTSYKINRVVSATGFYTHAVGARTVMTNEQNVNGGLNFDFKALANLERRMF